MHVNLEKALNNQKILMKRKNIRWITIPDFKIYYRTIVINTIWYWHRSRRVDKQNKTEDPNVSTCLQNHLIFDNEAKSINWGKVIVFTKRHSNPHLSSKFLFLEAETIAEVTVDQSEETKDHGDPSPSSYTCSMTLHLRPREHHKKKEDSKIVKARGTGSLFWNCVSYKWQDSYPGEASTIWLPKQDQTMTISLDMLMQTTKNYLQLAMLREKELSSPRDELPDWLSNTKWPEIIYEATLNRFSRSNLYTYAFICVCMYVYQ